MKKQYKIAAGILWIMICSLPCLLYAQTSTDQTRTAMNDKPSLLIHLSQGPENPTVAALAFLIARTAVEDGHDVTLFLAGDAVQLMRDEVLDNLNGLGTGSVREHYDVLAGAGCQFYLSGMSSKSRGLTQVEVSGKKVEFASPQVLLRLAMEKDKMFVY